MTKAICIRLDSEILSFIDTLTPEPNRTEAIKGMALWLQEYQDTYLASVKSYIQDRITRNT